MPDKEVAHQDKYGKDDGQQNVIAGLIISKVYSNDNMLEAVSEMRNVDEEFVQKRDQWGKKATDREKHRLVVGKGKERSVKTNSL